MVRTYLSSIIAFIFLALLFIGVSFFARTHEELITHLVHAGHGIGEVSFIFLTALFVIFVIPLDIALLIPLGSALWGPIPTAFMSIAGWVIGSAVAFSIARVWGASAVARLIGLSRVRAVEARIPRRNLFWSVVLLRMLVSVDILSYALGLFSRMRFFPYVCATALGVTPFAFYFAYAGTLPLAYQIVALVAAIGLATLVLVRYRLPRET